MQLDHSESYFVGDLSQIVLGGFPDKKSYPPPMRRSALRRMSRAMRAESRSQLVKQPAYAPSADLALRLLLTGPNPLPDVLV